MSDELNLQFIEDALKTEDSPVQLASFLTRLAAINSYRQEQLKKIMLLKPAKWLEIQSKDIYPNNTYELKPKPLSYNQTEMQWNATEEGQKEIALTFELRRIDILYRSINKRLSALETEFRMSKNL